jgi:hypothetical protein
MTLKWLVFSLIVILALQACNNQTPGAPEVVSLEATNIGDNQATLNGDIRNSGQLVEAFGFLVSTAPNVNIDNSILSKSFEGKRFGNYSVDVTLPRAIKDYYYVAMAKSKGDYVYGNEITIKLTGTATTSITSVPISFTVTGFSPEFGHIGTEVTISGDGFNVLSNNNIVSFGSVVANVKSISTKTKLFVVVPFGSMVNKSVPINVVIVKSTGNETWKSTNLFTITP